MTQQTENSRLEWKDEFTPAIKKEIVAFFNTNGGTIIIGKDDSSQSIGIKDAKSIIESVSTMIHEAIKPDASLICSAQEFIEKGKELVRIEIGRGVKKTVLYLRKRNEIERCLYPH